MMKLFTSIALAVAMIIAPLALIGCSSGCSSTPSRTTYVSSGVTHVAAVAALRGWNDYLGIQYKEIAELAATDAPKAEKRKEALLEKEKQVADAWKKYQASQIAVLTAAQEFSKIPANDPTAPNAQDRLNAAVAASTATLSQVIGLLQQFGIKI